MTITEARKLHQSLSPTLFALTLMLDTKERCRLCLQTRLGDRLIINFTKTVSTLLDPKKCFVDLKNAISLA